MFIYKLLLNIVFSINFKIELFNNLRYHNLNNFYVITKFNKNTLNIYIYITFY